MKTLFLLLLIPLTSWAQDCGYTISMGSFMASVQEQPQTLAHTLTLERKSPSANCENYRIYFGKGQANSYQRRAYSGSNSIPYNIYRSINQGNVLKDFGDAGPNEYITQAAASRNVPYTSTWYVGVNDLDAMFSSPPGVYTDVVPVHIYQVRTNGQVTHQTTRYLTLSFNLPRYAELSLVPENAPHNPSSTSYVMDFGELQPQEVLGADLRVVGNVGFGVLMSSMNGGKLVSGSDNVPYTISVGGGNYFNLSPAGAHYFVASRNSGTNTSGQRYNLKVRIGNFADLGGGDYQDVITITVQAW